MTETTPRDIHTLMAEGTIDKPEQMLNAEAKEALAAEGTPFTVNEVQVGDDPQFGPFWEVKAIVNDDPVSFRLSQHNRRDTFMQSLAGALASGPISGLRLRAYKGQGGNAFISIEPS